MLEKEKAGIPIGDTIKENDIDAKYSTEDENLNVVKNVNDQ